MATFTFRNSNSTANGTLSFSSGPHTIIVANGGYILKLTPPTPARDDAIFFQNAAYTVAVNGVVGSAMAGASGIYFANTAAGSKLTVGVEGYVWGAFTGVAAFAPVTVTNSGTIESGQNGIYQGSNANWTVTNNANGEIVATVAGILVQGAGTHTIKNAGAISAGTHSIFAAGLGMEIVTNTGTIGGDVDLGDGNDKFTNSGAGKVFGEILMGAGNDAFASSGTSFVLGDIWLGSGDDTFTGGNTADTITDEFGADIYKLGSGNDVFVAVGTGSADGNVDTVDGGAGADWYDARNATTRLLINLDTDDQYDRNGFYDPFPLLAAQTATESGNSSIGTDELNSIEHVRGGTGNDSIIGSAVVNILEGRDGSDSLSGLEGNDNLIGGDGNDVLWGGLGRDVLQGGVAGILDGDRDFFIYNTLKESTPGISGRDLIHNFEDGQDVIALNIFVGIGLGIRFIGRDVAFSETEAELRVQTTRAGWLIQLDADSNGTVDLAIEVTDATHAITWSTLDFAGL